MMRDLMKDIIMAIVLMIILIKPLSVLGYRYNAENRRK